MLEKYNTALQLVEFEVADSLLFEMDENINFNDDKYKWKED